MPRDGFQADCPTTLQGRIKIENDEQDPKNRKMNVGVHVLCVDEAIPEVAGDIRP